MHDAVSAAWDKVTEDWDNQVRHDALLQLTVAHDELKAVASKYRERKGDAIADAQLVKLTNAAMATILATATAKREKAASSPYKRALIWMLLFALMVVLGLIGAKLMASANHAPPP